MQWERLPDAEDGVGPDNVFHGNANIPPLG